MTPRHLALLGTLGGILAAGCGGEASSGAALCIPGRVEACVCPGGGTGAQACAEDGRSYETCVCGPASDDTGGPGPGTPGDVSAASDAIADGAADAQGLVANDTQDPGAQDTLGPSEACDPCGYGTVKGVVCAPSEQVFIAAGRVTLDAVDCDGSIKHLETTSAFDGSWTLEGVPCGLHTVNVKAGSFEKTFPVQVTAGKVSDDSGVGKKQCFKANATPIAVFWGQWDQQHELLDVLGLEYTYYSFADEYFGDVPDDEIEALQVLRSKEKLAAYRILFFNCGSAALKWVNAYPDIGHNLRDFVLAGGSLYASDLSWAYLEAAFPEAFDFYGDDDLPSIPGDPDGPQQAMANVEIAAYIVDPLLAEYVGVQEFTAEYGPGPLIAVTAAGPAGSTPHVMGGVKFEKANDPFGGYTIKDQPVVLSHQPAPGAGRVVYTTFHNDEQADAVMVKILQYLVFIL